MNSFFRFTKINLDLFFIYFYYILKNSCSLIFLYILPAKLEQNFVIFIGYFNLLIILSSCIEFGFGINGVSEISKKINEKDKVAKIIFSSFFIQIIIYLALCGVSFLLYPIKDHTFFSIFLLVLLTNGFSLYWIFRGINHIKFYLLIDLFSKVSYLIFVILFINNSNDIFLLFLFNLFFNLFAFVVYIIYLSINGYIRFFSINTQFFRETLKIAKDGLAFFLLRFFGSVVSFGSGFFASFFGFNNLAMDIGIIERIIQFLRNVPMYAWDYLFPKIMRERASISDSLLSINKIMIFASLIIFLLLLFIIFFGKYVYFLENIKYPLILSSFGILIASSLSSYGLGILVPFGNKSRMYNGIIYGGLFFVTLSPFIVQLNNIYFMILLNLFSLLISFLYIYHYSKKVILQKRLY